MEYLGAMTKTLTCALLAALTLPVFADQIEMQNGDRFNGRVLSLSADKVVLQNDNLGRITLPRGKVALLSIGAAPESGTSANAAHGPASAVTAIGPAGSLNVTLQAPVPHATSMSATANTFDTPTNQTPKNPKSIVITGDKGEIAAALKSLGANTNFIEQIRGQILSDAGPKANQQFNDMLGGLMGGQIDLSSLRAQAKSAADQLRAYQKEMGPAADDAFDSYLTILDNFLKETK